ncbi:MAG: hypothetical protein BWY45_02768 [Euryarchaeota archaeon ADurb.Bin294]|nr:MAG: hypothetical protein BWY45_02768 [Euryarchaeota archaeon ADurb.Bin294]
MYYDTSSHVASSLGESASSVTPTSKRVVHDPKSKVEHEIIETDLKENVSIHRGKEYLDHKMKVGDMEVVVNHKVRDDDSPIEYMMLVKDKSGSQRTLMHNDFGKFIRLKTIATFQKEEATKKEFEDKARQLNEEQDNNPILQEMFTKRNKMMRGIGPYRKLVESLPEGSEERAKGEARLNELQEELWKFNEEIDNHPEKKVWNRKEKNHYYQFSIFLNESNNRIRDSIFEYLPDDSRAKLTIVQDNNDRKIKGYPNECSPEDQNRITKLVSRYIPSAEIVKQKGCTLGIHIDPYENSRSCCSEDVIFLHGRDGNRDHVIIHEFGHALEHQVDVIAYNSSQFFRYRTKDEELKPLRSISESYDENEYYRADEFSDPYCGKDYGRYGHSELISMGLQKLHEDPAKFAMEDGEYFDMIICCLYGQEWHINGYNT